MKIQIFQHLPTLPKAGIFCPLPILCVAFRAFIPDRNVFRCSLSPVFLCSAPSSRCINPHTLSRTPPLPRATLLPHPSPHLPLHSTPAYRHPPPRFQHRPPDASTRDSTPAPDAVQPLLPGAALSRHTPIHSTPPHTGTRRPASHTRLPPASSRDSAPTPLLYSHHSPTPQSSQQIGASALATTIQLPPPHTQA